MKKNARPTDVKASAPGTGAQIVTPSRFMGTDNPRYLRILNALLARSRTREDIDNIAGASNGPAAIAALRALGLSDCLPCAKTPTFDRDGKEVTRGVYYLTPKGKRLVWAWVAHRKQRPKP